MRILAFLEEHQYIQRVLVIRSSEDRQRQHKCLKYLKDIPERDSLLNDELEYQDILDDGDSRSDDENDEKAIFDQDEVPEEPFEAREEDNVQEITTESVAQMPTFTRLFPLENQLYNIISSRGEQGISSMELTRLAVGRDYYRIFTAILDKCIESSIQHSGSKSKSSIQPSHLGQYSLVRATDSSARLKYYRYFTLPAYRKYLHEPLDDAWGFFESANSNNFQEFLDTLVKLLPQRHIISIPMSENAEGERGRLMKSSAIFESGY